MHAEFSEEYKKVAHVRPQRRRKNSSVHSIRPTSELKAAGVLASSQKENQGSVEANKSDLPARSRQKKGADDAASHHSAEAAQPVRMRHNVVIHYDGHTQKELEQVVRDIGLARNSIRKGKMSQMMRKSGVDMLSARLTSRESKQGFTPMNGSPLSGRSTRTMQQKESSFDYADKQLELAQSLCETAAHQFLRCGDCSTELEGVKEKFNLLLEVANSEAARLRAEKEQEEAQEREKEKEREQEQKQAKTEEPPAKVDPDKPVDVTENGKPPEPGVAAIEVDDAASDSSVSIDITAFRASRFRA
ncbi:hypothetical protein T310_6127 [Rasamsonia emersonii CBS 393.64]|uniref:Uncharacterized protein n=1 Tax=Rasamsonia emersonii (strain ATCC 16479 / CBS 393.64 / IMI 116815) TaxID=1408163 RepID=A0A0F4YNP5_RASE3|nr:hypothetical protein T310_6127 [Rasamsonia emersonii CBS 393.64]KKA19864.1 hypothetical protein T310_6127 [Rasamsonia emersonii CBS 393.64]